MDQVVSPREVAKKGDEVLVLVGSVWCGGTVGTDRWIDLVSDDGKVRYSWRLTDEQARILIPGSRSSVGGEARVGGLNKNR
jgi:hypothetical protein